MQAINYGETGFSIARNPEPNDAIKDGDDGRVALFPEPVCAKACATPTGPGSRAPH